MICLAAACMWGALCLTFWLGSWQLLYHPLSAVATTPDSAGMAFQSVDFAPSQAGRSQLHGWWIPASSKSRFTAIYLHGADGNIGDTIQWLTPLHFADLNVLVFDYRGYGTSVFDRPSEANWLDDAESAITYLKSTRHIPPDSILLVGTRLGADLALEVGAAHPEIAGIVLDHPLADADDAVLNDPRARLVPARWLMRDRWSLREPASALKIPSLWLLAKQRAVAQLAALNGSYDLITARKQRIWRDDSDSKLASEPLTRWLDDLGKNP
ncbi:MAG TPA: alpha/beta hydrolase [Terracidiphilus sp.]|nr:alpha/beta hydrolase [Terracidiphilus sp.]